MGKSGNPLLAIFVIIVTIGVLYYFITTNNSAVQTVGQIIKFPSGSQVTFYLPPPPPQLTNLQQQFSSNPYYSSILNKLPQTSSQQSTTSTNSVNQTSSQSVTPVDKNVGQFQLNGKQSPLQNPSSTVTGVSLNTQVPVVQMGDPNGLSIIATMQMVDPVTKLKILSPYQYIMQIICTSQWCNNDNLPTPKGETDLSGTLKYRFMPNPQYNTAGDYIAKITFISEDGKQVQIEVEYPFTVLPAPTK